MDNKIYKKIQDLRRDKGIKQKEIADKLGIHPSAYSKLEGGKRKNVGMEQFKIIARTLGTDLEGLLLEENKLSIMNSNSRAALNNKIELLEKIICLVSVDFQKLVQDAWSAFQNRLPDYPTPFEDYINNEPGANPQLAFDIIKRNIADYERFLKKYNYEITEDNFEEIFYKESEAGDYDCYNKEDYEYFKNYSDQEIVEFVTKPENYSFVHGIMMSPSYIKEEDAYNGFKEMLKEQPIIELILASGLVRNYSYYERYIGELETNFSIPNNAIEQHVYWELARRNKDESNIRKKIDEKLKDILQRNKIDKDFYDWNIIENFKADLV